MLLGQYNGSATDTQYITARPTADSLSGQISANTTISATTATTYLVGKVVFNSSGTSDSVYFWVNPSGAAALENNASANASLSNQVDLGSLGKFGLYIDGSSGYSLDEVRIARDASLMFGAIPEPSAYALASGLAVFGVAFFRRRHT